MHDVTLQINLCAGDIAYAQMTVPFLVEAHRKNVSEKVAVVDCCRPQRTRIIEPDLRFPQPQFSQAVEQICLIAENLKSRGYFDRIIYLRADDPVLRRISGKYFRNVIQETHNYRGIALMAYLVTFEACRTSFVLHYDADMLLYQEPGYDWSTEAKSLINLDKKAVAATPRVFPPLDYNEDPASLYLGKPMESFRDAWYNDWFSARCYLKDLAKFKKYLPLLKGRIFLETLVRKYLNRSYPLSLESIISRRLSRSGCHKLYLKSKRAWLLHPDKKSSVYLKHLPKIQDSIKKNRIPEEQRGHEDLILSAWEDFLAE